MASRLHVLISGAGVAGLMTGALLQKAGISFEASSPTTSIFEKAKELRPLGAAMSLSPAVVSIFEQLGLYEELCAMSKPSGGLHLKKQDLTPIGSFLAYSPGLDIKERYGDDGRMISRPDLIKLLMTMVPLCRIHLSKRILSTTQDEHKVVITCADNTSYEGSILIGADGAYSSVRQNMYKVLTKIGCLPKNDAKPLGYSFDCLVGVTSPLDPSVYPVCDEKYSEFQIILGTDVPNTWWFMPLSGNRLGWMVTKDIRGEGVNGERNFRFSEWGSDAALEMCNEVRHFRSPYGGTIGDIIDFTSKDLISKVMLEDKMLPFGGQGANTAIQGAVELVNLLFDIYTDSQEEITQVFEQYYKARHASSAAAVDVSNQTAYLMHKKGILANIARHVFLHWLPNWVFQLASDKYNEYRKQISFLPFIKIRGTFRSKTNSPSRRMVPGSSIPNAV
ncbi:hypothetical protein CPC16_008098 [Podila verticillata]|nr:hypothetical protein CPC16_008098 [Podila verticillata]